MHIFVLYIEPLLVRLAQSLQGIRVIDKTLTVRAFFNDVTICLSSDSEVFNAISNSEIYQDEGSLQNSLYSPISALQ
jgi:hypothetical protein